jgi:hypothetical protein
MNTEIVAQMWSNYQSNVQFHLEGMEADGQGADRFAGGSES